MASPLCARRRQRRSAEGAHARTLRGRDVPARRRRPLPGLRGQSGGPQPAAHLATAAVRRVAAAVDRRDGHRIRAGDRRHRSGCDRDARLQPRSSRFDRRRASSDEAGSGRLRIRHPGAGAVPSRGRGRGPRPAVPRPGTGQTSCGGLRPWRPAATDAARLPSFDLLFPCLCFQPASGRQRLPRALGQLPERHRLRQGVQGRAGSRPGRRIGISRRARRRALAGRARRRRSGRSGHFRGSGAGKAELSARCRFQLWSTPARRRAEARPSVGP